MLLEIDNVTRSFGGNRAVDGVSLALAAGELAGLIGPNGAGKTTLFNLVAGALPVHGGAIRFQGERLRSPVAACRAGLARTFQNVRLFRDLTVLENVMAGMGGLGFVAATLRLRRTRNEERLRRKKAYYLLEDAGIGELADRRAADIPFGQQRLVEIARALATRPQLLLLDEPAAGLNRTEVTALAGLIRRIWDGGTAVLLVEHDMQLVMGLVPRLIVLESGRKIADGSPAAVRADPAVRAAYLGTPQL